MDHYFSDDSKTKALAAIYSALIFTNSRPPFRIKALQKIVYAPFALSIYDLQNELPNDRGAFKGSRSIPNNPYLAGG